jgi:hypothetical protein
MLLREDAVLASADVVGAKKFLRRPTITMTEPFAARVVRTSGWFTVRYDVMRGGETMGTIAERGRVTARRELLVDLPDSLGFPVQIFMFFLVHNHAYG